MNSLLTEYPIVAALGELIQLFYITNGETLRKENPRKLLSFLERVQSLFTELGGLGEELTPPTPTSFKGILNDLLQLKEILFLYQSKSRLYQLVHCRGLNDILQSTVHKLAKWLTLLTMGLQHNFELCKKLNDLSSEMERTQLKVSDMEDLICRAIDDELNNWADHTTNDALITNIAQEFWMTNARDVSQLSLQIELYKKDIEDSISPRDKQIADILEKFLRNRSLEPEAIIPPVVVDVVEAEEEKPIPAFRTFICPLSKEVMKTPVVLETGHTYEQIEIEKWFKRCAEDGRQPTCPVTGQVLSSSNWKKNLVLQNTIEEWHDRNFKTRISRAKQKLSLNAAMKDFEDAVDEVHKISEESTVHRHTLRNEGIIPLLLGPWQEPLKDGDRIREKVLVALHSMAVHNEENKLEMVKENAVRYAVKSLTSSLEQEKQSAAQLLCELSSQPEICVKIGIQKGAILLLSGLVNSGENATLANLASQTLRNLEEEHLNVIPMAEAGRFEPLLDCLIEGPSDAKLLMARHLSQMTLSNNDKEMAVKRVGSVLIEMLSHDTREKEAAIKALLMLSTPSDNAVLLVNSGILPPLFSFIKSVHSMSDSSTIKLKEEAAEILVNLVSKPGHWEFAEVTLDGSTLQSESVIHCILGLMTRVGLKWKPNLLRVLYYIASSSETADAAALHIHCGNGIALLISIRESDVESHQLALKLLGILSLRRGSEVAEELRQSHKFDRLKNLLKGFEPEEQAAAASILANVPLTETEIVQVLGIELLPWIIDELNKTRNGRLQRGGSASISMMEGLLSLLLQFCKCSNEHVLQAVRDHDIVMVLKEYLIYTGHPPLKKLAAEGLKILSQKTTLRVDTDPQPSCSCLAFLHKRKTLAQASCPVHGIACEETTTFCLVKANAVKPLVELLKDDDVAAQLAAVGALSTLIEDSNNLKDVLEEFDKADGIKCIIDLFCRIRSGELQDSLVWMIEKITQVEEICQKYSVDQVLIKTLVQAFRTGNPATKRLAQTALTNLKQLSGMGGANIF